MSVIGFKVDGDVIQYNFPNLDNKPTIDATPTANSTNAVQSGGVKSALDTLQAQIPAIDPTLTQSGEAADAKVVGDAIYNYTAGEYVIKMPESVKIEGFNPNTGYGNTGTTNRIQYRGGFSLMGAKLIDVEIANGYKWNIYFANTAGAYSLVEQYSTRWVEETRRLIPVPDGADRLYIQCLKSDESNFSESEIQGVFNIMLRGAKEKEVINYDKNTNLYTDYYGHYQYVDAAPSVNQQNRLTQDRIYKIGNHKIIGFIPNTGYKAVINFFDSDLNRLGNNGAWITAKSVIPLNGRYTNAKYFKLTYCKNDNTNLSESDYNSFSVFRPNVQAVLPVFSNKPLDFVNYYSFNSGDIAAYNGDLFFPGYINGVSVPATGIGHGNNIMFGKTLDGYFPRLYAGSWYQGQKNIYVNRVTLSSFELINTITYNELPTGYLNMCVDEANERAYIFMETGEDTYQGNILFAVGDFNGNIVSSHNLDVKIPIIQGLDFYNGYIYLTAGNGTANYPNHMFVFDISGKLISMGNINIQEEIEGMCFDIDGTIYIKGIHTLYKL